MAVLGSVLGPLSEGAVLGLVGTGLYAGSAMLQGKLAAPPEGLAKEA